MLLLDTSVWIEIFRANSSMVPAEVFDFDEVVTCLPVVQEVLQGFRDEDAFRRARAAMWSLPCLESPLTQEVYERAVDLYRLARRSGLTVRSGVDCLIAACAIRHNMIVLHRDRDFPALARISTLRERAA